VRTWFAARARLPNRAAGSIPSAASLRQDFARRLRRSETRRQENRGPARQRQYAGPPPHITGHRHEATKQIRMALIYHGPGSVSFCPVFLFSARFFLLFFFLFVFMFFSSYYLYFHLNRIKVQILNKFTINKVQIWKFMYLQRN
jgi:hypothetical protein